MKGCKPARKGNIAAYAVEQAVQPYAFPAQAPRQYKNGNKGYVCKKRETLGANKIRLRQHKEHNARKEKRYIYKRFFHDFFAGTGSSHRAFLSSCPERKAAI